jgi:hypothetical protein
VATDPKAGGATYLLSDSYAQETLAPSLLLLYGEVEHTGYYEKMGHRANIASLLKYLWKVFEPSVKTNGLFYGTFELSKGIMLYPIKV